MKTLINNFVGGAPIRLAANVHPEIGPLVSIVQSLGSIRFQHSITPKQAREMAASLVILADSFDAVLV
jgi:hypothetical protein